MKQCKRCRTPWRGSGQPSSRRVCEGCGAYLHSCINCHHFDARVSNSCRLKTTFYVGPRDAANYCDDYRMIDVQLRAVEDRTQRARHVWEQLFKA